MELEALNEALLFVSAITDRATWNKNHVSKRNVYSRYSDLPSGITKNYLALYKVKKR